MTFFVAEAPLQRLFYAHPPIRQRSTNPQKHCMWRRNHKIHQKSAPRSTACGEKPRNTRNTRKRTACGEGNHKIHKIHQKALRAALPAWEESTENTDHTEKHCMWGFTAQAFPTAVGWLIHAARGSAGAAQPHPYEWCRRVRRHPASPAPTPPLSPNPQHASACVIQKKKKPALSHRLSE
jgi:hypothetical protein